MCPSAGMCLVLLCLRPTYCETATDAAYMGCYVDNTLDIRLLEGLRVDFPTMLTPNICIQYCAKIGFPYAGTEYRIECYCSRIYPADDKQTADIECDSKCDGDEHKMCGGSNRLSVYRTVIKDNKDYETAAYIGCYIDNALGIRLLQGMRKDFPNTLVPDICKKLCYEKGFPYAGVEYSSECYCSRTRPADDKQTADTECNTKCAGDKSKNCGGSNRLSVYTTGIKDNKDHELAAYIGCYIDNTKGMRLLLGLKQDFPQILTTDICKNLCFEKGFAYAGTQFSYECFCSRTKPADDKKTADTECDAKCDGDKSKTCGGTDRLSVYTTGIRDNQVSDPTVAFIGCYIDNSLGVRLLQGLQQDFLTTLTPQLCDKYCFDRGFAYAGTQYRYECFCSRMKPADDKKAIDTECDAICAGDESKFCGGVNRLSVYATGIKDNKDHETAAYIGCYIDSTLGIRLLQGLKQDFNNVLTPEICKKLCFEKGFAYAGTQYSYECFCSRLKPADDKQTVDTECNAKCAGDESKMCGGTDRLSVYTTGFKETQEMASAAYIGCYIDNTHGIRLLQGLWENYRNTLTPEICKKVCFEKGFAYAGMQFNHECFCSSTKPGIDKKTDESNCNAKCDGDESQICGGIDRLSVYTTGIRDKQVSDSTEAYIGCYIDNSLGVRLLQGLQQNFVATLTPQVCDKHCFDKGFAYAGTQNSNECFCSKTKPPDDKKTADTECDAKCNGDESKTCGGANRLSVHTTGIRDPHSTGDDTQFRYIGCFRDFSNGTRLMKGYRQVFPDVLSNQLCSRLCRNRGFRYAGMEHGNECYCDNSRPSYMNYAKDEDCSKRCDGNFLQLCGGQWRLSIFETGVPDDTTKHDYAGNYVGCYKDLTNPRYLNGHEEYFGNILTPFRCTGLCYSMGFLYAGTQSGKHCYCGDKHPNPNFKTGEDRCSTPCSGDPTQKCGGDLMNSIHDTGIPDVPAYENYLGCFNDLNNQILKGLKITFKKTNTPRRCMNYCLQLGFKYSGVEYGTECFCGNQEPGLHFTVSGDQCNMVCSGDLLETCGATWRMAVYYTDSTVEPLTNPHVMPVTATTKPCQVSQTSVDGRAVCRGDIIFDDDFNTPLGNNWKHVVKIADTPDHEFAVFQSNPKNSFVAKSALVIKPTLVNDTKVLTGSIYLQSCTGTLGTRECGYQAFSFNILPPVVSARLNTRHSFAFRYGTVEIKAKLPIGDWLVPELWLEPKSQAYGPHYASGRIRLVMSRGNQELQCDGKDLSSNHLESCVVMGTGKDVRSHCISSTVPDNWHDHFHTYTLIWKPDSISFKVDDEMPQDIVPQGVRLCDAAGFTSDQCSLWGLGSNIAPFDTEFYVSLGLSSGNARDFPDSCVSRGRPKPWKNSELVKALLKFWQDKENWRATWSDEKSALYIEHVRVTAL